MAGFSTQEARLKSRCGQGWSLVWRVWGYVASSLIQSLAKCSSLQSWCWGPQFSAGGEPGPSSCRLPEFPVMGPFHLQASSAAGYPSSVLNLWLPLLPSVGESSLLLRVSVIISGPPRWSPYFKATCTIVAYLHHGRALSSVTASQKQDGTFGWDQFRNCAYHSIFRKQETINSCFLYIKKKRLVCFGSACVSQGC